MFDFAIGLGQGGGRLARTFKEGFTEMPTVYMNLAGIDFAHMTMDSRSRLVFEEGGTGRNPKFGESVVLDKFRQVETFLDRGTFHTAKSVLVTVGGGGGAGTGFLFPILDFLLAEEKDVFVVYTLPEKREGLPTKPNALEALDRLIAKYIQKHRISILTVDNDYCVSRYGTGADYWKSVNEGIVTSLKRFWVMTNLKAFASFIDVSAGYKALDRNDLRRILFAKNGFTDLRRMEFAKPVTEEGGLMRIIRESSLVFGSLDIRTTKQYVISIAIPMEWKTYSWTADFVEDIFDHVSKATRHTPAVIRTSYYNKKIKTLQVSLLLSGMARSKGIDKMIRGTLKDQQRLAEREGVDRLDIGDVLRESRKR